VEAYRQSSPSIDRFSLDYSACQSRDSLENYIRFYLRLAERISQLFVFPTRIALTDIRYRASEVTFVPADESHVRRPNIAF